MSANRKSLDTELDRPVLIMGTPRSGKSMLSYVMRSAEEFIGMSEPFMMWNIGMGSYDDDCRTAEEVTPRLRRQITRMCIQNVERNGKKRYLDDLVHHMLRIPFIHQVMPEARLIHVVRDAEGAIPEMLYGWKNHDTLRKVIRRRYRGLKLRTLPHMLGRFAVNYVNGMRGKRRSYYGPIVPGFTDFVASHSSAEIAAYQWLKLMEIAQQDLRTLPEKNWMKVRFEDMVRNTRCTIANICEFCEVEDPQTVITFAEQYIDLNNMPAYAQHGKEEPTQAEWESIREMISPI